MLDIKCVPLDTLFLVKRYTYFESKSQIKLYLKSTLRPLSPSELTPIVSNFELTHLGLEASIFNMNFKQMFGIYNCINSIWNFVLDRNLIFRQNLCNSKLSLNIFQNS